MIKRVKTREKIIQHVFKKLLSYSGTNNFRKKQTTNLVVEQCMSNALTSMISIASNVDYDLARTLFKKKLRNSMYVSDPIPRLNDEVTASFELEPHRPIFFRCEYKPQESVINFLVNVSFPGIATEAPVSSITYCLGTLYNHRNRHFVTCEIAIDSAHNANLRKISIKISGSLRMFIKNLATFKFVIDHDLPIVSNGGFVNFTTKRDILEVESATLTEEVGLFLQSYQMHSYYMDQYVKLLKVIRDALKVNASYGDTDTRLIGVKSISSSTVKSCNIHTEALTRTETYSSAPITKYKIRNLDIDSERHLLNAVNGVLDIEFHVALKIKSMDSVNLMIPVFLGHYTAILRVFLRQNDIRLFLKPDRLQPESSLEFKNYAREVLHPHISNPGNQELGTYREFCMGTYVQAIRTSIFKGRLMEVRDMLDLMFSDHITAGSYRSQAGMLRCAHTPATLIPALLYNMNIKSNTPLHRYIGKLPFSTDSLNKVNQVLGMCTAEQVEYLSNSVPKTLLYDIISASNYKDKFPFFHSWKSSATKVQEAAI